MTHVAQPAAAPEKPEAIDIKSIEIEAKYRIVDQRLGPRLRTRKTLSRRYHLTPAVQSDVVDVYMDTKDAKLLRSGYSLRLRVKNNKRLVTLKSLHSESTEPEIQDQPNSSCQDSPAIHRRFELEEALDPEAKGPRPNKPLKPSQLPHDVANALVQIAGKKSKLSPLCTVSQKRYERQVAPAHTRARRPYRQMTPVTQWVMKTIASKRALHPMKLRRFL